MMKENAMVKVLMALVLMAGVATAQDGEKKRAGGMMGLPTAADLKEKCGLDDEQVKKVEELYASYKEKAAEAMKKAKESEDQKAARKDLQALRGEIAGKVVEVGKDDDQKKKLTEATAPPQKNK
jgi:hypothetical protein